MPIVPNLPANAPDAVYALLQQAVASVPASPNANQVAVVGTFNSGPVGTPTLVSSPQQLVDVFGTDEAGLTGWMEAYTALLQGGAIWVVRITDGTDVAASATVNQASGGQAGARFVSPYTGDDNNGAQVIVAAGSVSGANNIQLVQGSKIENYVNVSFAQSVPTGASYGVTAMAGSQIAPGLLPVVTSPSVAPTVTPSTTGGTMAQGEVYGKMWWSTAAGNTIPGPEFSFNLTGSGSTNSASIAPPAAPTEATGWGVSLSAASDGEEYVAGTATSPTAAIVVTSIPTTGQVIPADNTATYYPTGALATGTYQLSGGTNGTTGVTPTSYVGSNTNGVRTGMQALAAMPSGVNLAAFWFAGQSDATANASASEWTESHGAVFCANMPAGLSPTAAETVAQTLQTAGIPGWTMGCYNWQTSVSPYTGLSVLVSPAAYACGILATLNPWQSPGNKAMVGSLGGQYNVSLMDDGPTLQGANLCGIGPIARGGNGFMSGQTLDGGEVSTALMRAYVGNLTTSVLGPLVEEAIDDQTEKQATQLLTGAWQAMLKAGDIAAYSVVCDSTNNTAQSEQAGNLVVDQVISLNYRARRIIARTTVAPGAQVQTSTQVA